MKTKHIIILAVAIFLLGALSGGFLQHSWDMRSLDRTDTVTVWKPAVLDTASMVATTVEAPPSVPPVVIPAKHVEMSKDSTTVQIRPQLTTVSGSLSGGLTYQAQLTGIQPQLQSLQVFYPETTRQKTLREPYKGWLVSATSSIAAFSAPQFQAFGTAGLEVSYNVGRFHVGLQGGAAGNWSPSGYQVYPYVGGRITFDIFRMK